MSASLPPHPIAADADARRRYEEAGWWDEATLSELVRTTASRHGDRVAVVDLEGARRRTYAELDRDADRVAAYLVQLGVVPGDVVAIQLPNWYEHVALALGVLRAGAVLNPMVTIYRRRELTHMVGAAKSKVLLTPETYRGFDHAVLGQEVCAEFPELVHLTVADPTVAPDAFDAWLAELPQGPLPAPRAASFVSEVLFSSGTEAAPKAIMHTEQTANAGVRTAASSLGLTDRDIVWMPSPIGHSTGFNFGLRMAFVHGLPLVLQDKWDPAVGARLVEAEQCTYTVAATTFLADLVRHCEQNSVILPSLRLFGSGGAPVPPDLVAAAARHQLTVLRLYGSTEVLVATWNRPGATPEQRQQTDGLPLDGVELEVRDESGRSIVGSPGEIFVRGPACTVGFLGDPVRTAATIDAEGWVASGDLGVLDTEGHLTIVGRKKEIIIRGGMNVAPREVEDLIASLPGIDAVAVVGLPDDRLGEIGCACVVPSPGVELTLADLVAALKEQGLASFKLPERLAVFPELPRTASGKVQKHRLLDALAERSESLSPTGS